MKETGEMIEVIQKLSALLKSSHFPLFLFASFMNTKVIKEKKEEDLAPGDNFPHVFMRAK